MAKTDLPASSCDLAVDLSTVSNAKKIIPTLDEHPQRSGKESAFLASVKAWVPPGRLAKIFSMDEAAARRAARRVARELSEQVYGPGKDSNGKRLRRYCIPQSDWHDFIQDVKSGAPIDQLSKKFSIEPCYAGRQREKALRQINSGKVSEPIKFNTELRALEQNGKREPRVQRQSERQEHLKQTFESPSGKAAEILKEAPSTSGSNGSIPITEKPRATLTPNPIAPASRAPSKPEAYRLAAVPFAKEPSLVDRPVSTALNQPRQPPEPRYSTKSVRSAPPLRRIAIRDDCEFQNMRDLQTDNAAGITNPDSPLLKAIKLLHPRVKSVGSHGYTLDGRNVGTRDIVREANKILSQLGEPELPWPGLKTSLIR